MSAQPCSKCGYQNLEGANFCYQCGNQLASQASTDNASALSQVDGTSHPSHILFWFLSALSALGFVIASVTFCYSLYRLAPAIFQDIKFQPPLVPEEGGQRVTARETDRLKQAATVFTNPILVTDKVQDVTLADLIGKKQNYDQRPVSVVGLVTKLVKLENLLEDDWPTAYLLELAGEEKKLLVLYRGDTSRLNISDPVRVDGVFLQDEQIIHASSVMRLNADPFVESWQNLWLVRLTIVTVLWMAFCVAFYLWRAGRYYLFRPSLVISILLAALVTFSVSACEIHITTVIAEDDAGSVTTMLSETMENMEYFRQIPGMIGYLEAWKQSLREQGLLVDQSASGAQEHIAFQRNFAGLDDFMQQDFTQVNDPSWVAITRYQEGGEIVYRFTALVDTREFYENIEGVDSNALDYIKQQFNQLEMNYTVCLPGKVVYHNGETENGKQVNWKLRMNDVNEVIVESRVMIGEKFSQNSLSFIPIVIACVIIFVFSTTLLIGSLFGYRLPKSGAA